MHSGLVKIDLMQKSSVKLSSYCSERLCWFPIFRLKKFDFVFLFLFKDDCKVEIFVVEKVLVCHQAE
jgi:hypothetical protein